MNKQYRLDTSQWVLHLIWVKPATDNSCVHADAHRLDLSFITVLVFEGCYDKMLQTDGLKKNSERDSQT